MLDSTSASEASSGPGVRDRSTRLVLGLACLLGCGDSGKVLEYTDLLRRAEQQEVLEGARLQTFTWNLSGDHRPLLFQHPPSRVALGPRPAGEDCRIHFSLGINSPAWSQSDGVDFRIALETATGVQVLFEESLDPRTSPAAEWRERTIPIPDSSPPGARLVFETRPGAAGNRDSDHAGWASPHIVCRVPRPASPELRAPHVILVSIDTLRPDHLGAYGYERDTSPVLDELALESLVFENAFSPSPWTLPAHASLFTGLYPEEHGAGHAAPFVPLGAGVATLAEHLRAAGYRTLAFSAGGVMSRSNGLARGFERWTEWTKANLRSVLPGVFAELETRADRPVFLFLHTYDVHGPYAEWERPDAEAAAGPDEAEWRRIRGIRYHDYLLLDRFGGLDGVVAAYDAGIRSVDAQLGSLFERLREIGMYDPALIIVTSDHGESLYERGLYIGHSYSLHDEEIGVPLIVRLPEASRAGRSRDLVSLVDVVPLVLHVTGAPAPENLSGVDPLRILDRTAPARSSLRGEATHTGARYWRTLERKWITKPHPRGSRWSRVPGGLWDRFEWDGRTYDLSRDPGEKESIGDPEALADAAIGPSAAWLHSDRIPGVGGEETPIGVEQAEQLRALGYFDPEGGTPPGERREGAR